MRTESKKLLFDIARACRSTQEKVSRLLEEVDALLREPESPDTDE